MPSCSWCPALVIPLDGKVCCCICLRLEPRGLLFGLGAPIGISVGKVTAAGREGTMAVVLCDVLCDELI